MSQRSAAEYIRHGQAPFFRLPTADFERQGAGAYAGAGAVLLGAPFDGGATYQPGARLAPFAVRRVSALVQGHHPGHGLDVFDALHAVDGGNVMFPMFQPTLVREAIQVEVGAVIEAGAVPFLVGGDHSVALPAMRSLARAHGPLAVVHVDAHLDTSGPETWMEPFHHGTPFRHAIQEGLVGRGQLHQIGIRGPWGTGEDAALSTSHGGKIHDASAVERRGIAAVMEEVRREVAGLPVYLSFDIDAVDPAFAPGTGTPVPGGLTSREALSLVRALAGVRLVGMDLVEVCPALDHADITAHLAAHLLFEGLALAALARKPGARR